MATVINMSATQDISECKSIWRDGVIWGHEVAGSSPVIPVLAERNGF